MGKRKPKKRATVASVSRELADVKSRVILLEGVAQLAAEAWTTIQAYKPEVAERLHVALVEGGFLDHVEVIPGLLGQPFFAEIRPYMRLEFYDRDGGHKDPRVRIACHRMPDKLWARVLEHEMPCVSCGKAIHPFRDRQRGAQPRSDKQHVYYAATCPLSVNISCSRQDPSSDEYRRVRAELGDANHDPPTPQLAFPRFR
jgi:hypothetical protein